MRKNPDLLWSFDLLPAELRINSAVLMGLVLGDKYERSMLWSKYFNFSLSW